MVAALLQLHHQIDETRNVALQSLGECFVVFRQDPADKPKHTANKGTTSANTLPTKQEHSTV